MNRLYVQRLLVLFFAFAVLALFVADLQAQNFVYTNNDVPGANTVSAFSVAPNGVLAQIAGSPFATGGAGSGGGFFASNRATVYPVGNFLYVSNDASSNISAFSINPVTGNLTPVPGSPFPTGGAGGIGISLTVTPNNQFLFSGNSGSNNISAFAIAPNGALAPVAGSPFPAGGTPDGMKVSPTGQFLSVAFPSGAGSVAMFSIAPNGALAPVPGSPFPDGGPGVAAGVDINCAGNLLFAGEATGGTFVDVFNIAPNGTLAPIPGSPFFFGGANNSNVVLLSPNDQFLFVSNQSTNSVTVFTVAPNGALAVVPGSPFLVGGGAFFTSGMATNPAGTLLYTANFPNLVGVFTVAGNGVLAPVPGSPFTTGQGFGLLALAAFPPKPCVLAINLDIHPQSCPNPLNTKSNGVVPAAILGTANLNVANINPSTVKLAGVSPLRWSVEDVSAPVANPQGPCDCTTAGADGSADLTLKFDTQAIVAALGPVTNGATIPLTLTGKLNDGTPIEGKDCVIIRSKAAKPIASLDNAPNPFNPSTLIRYTLGEESDVRLTIYNVLGQEVRTLVNAAQSPGVYSVQWGGRDALGRSVASGLYLYRLQAGSDVAVRNMIFAK